MKHGRPVWGSNPPTIRVVARRATKEKEKEPALPTANCRWRKSEERKKIKDQQM